MARRNSRLIRRLVIIVIALIAGAFFKDGKFQGFDWGNLTKNTKPSEQIEEADLRDLGKQDEITSKREGRYYVLEDCELVNHRHNDGDSFHVRVPSGRNIEFRLYFVDAPESALKTYRDGNTNEKRLRDQGDYFSISDLDKVARIGKAAKEWVIEQLEESTFTVYTAWDTVYQGPRCYAFVQLNNGGAKRYLHELLVERGLARIHTQKADLPDGRSMGSQASKLRSYERDARRAKRGAWGLSN